MSNYYVPDIQKMYTYLTAFFRGANMTESLKALTYAREKHDGQIRKDGKTPYIVHPLSMACYAAGLGIRDDNIMATILLHDVCEDCGIDLDSLPFNDCIKSGVKHVTVTKLDTNLDKLDTNLDKLETKRRYFSELLESREATITKAIDRYNNLSDMIFCFTPDAIGKNTAETEILLLPVLKKAKSKWCDLSDLLYVLRNNIRSINDVLKVVYNEEYESWRRKYNGET